MSIYILYKGVISFLHICIRSHIHICATVPHLSAILLQPVSIFPVILGYYEVLIQLFLVCHPS